MDCHIAGAQRHVRPELFLVVEGIKRIRFPTETYDQRAGQICLVPRGMPHAETFVRRRGRFRNLSLFFPADAGLSFIYTDLADDAAASRRRFGSAQADDRARIIAALDGLAQLAHLQDAWSRKARNGLLFGILAWLGAMLNAHASSGRRFSTMVYRALRLIDERLEDTALGTSTLASGIGCAADYLSDLFHKETGVTLIRYIHTQRIEKARFLLEDSRMRVKEVAAACGFANPNYFCRLFRSLTGHSPRQHCALQRNQADSLVAEHRL